MTRICSGWREWRRPPRRPTTKTRSSWPILHKDGHWVWLEAHPTPLRDASGRVREFLDIIRDVSAQVRIAEQLNQAKLAAEAAAAAKSEFVANIDHEIRSHPDRHPRLHRPAA